MKSMKEIKNESAESISYDICKSTEEDKQHKDFLAFTKSAAKHGFDDGATAMKEKIFSILNDCNDPETVEFIENTIAGEEKIKDGRK